MPFAPDLLVGHTVQRSQLAADLEQKNVAHAYVFTGPPHIGKFTVAKWFAQNLLCSSQSPETCQQMRSQIDRLLHPDLFVLDQLWIEDVCEDWAVIARSSNIPQEHRMKAGAKSNRISIDDIRILQERLHETSMGPYRCCLIRSIERMEDPPANALLKILEEPPQGVIFLLTTESLSSILPTVISRSRVLRFSPLSSTEMQPLLEGMETDERHFLLHVAQGAPGSVKRLKDNPDALRRERLFHAQATAFWKAKTLLERLKILSVLHEGEKEAQSLLLHLALTLREEDIIHPSYEQALRTLARGLETNVQRPLLAQQFALATCQVASHGRVEHSPNGLSVA